MNLLWNVPDTLCPLCQQEEEISLHLFQNYQVARAGWFGSSWGVGMDLVAVNSSFELVNFIIKEQRLREQFAILAVCFCRANILPLEIPLKIGMHAV
jgi:hypothetical protein